MTYIPKNPLRGISGHSKIKTKKSLPPSNHTPSLPPKFTPEILINIAKKLPLETLNMIPQVNKGMTAVYNTVLINRFRPTNLKKNTLERDSRLVHKLLRSKKAAKLPKKTKSLFPRLRDNILEGLVQPAYYPLNAARLILYRSAKNPKFTRQDLINIGFKIEIPKDNENNAEFIQNFLNTEIPQEYGAFLYKHLPDLLTKKQDWDLNAFLEIPSEYILPDTHGIIDVYKNQAITKSEKDDIVKNMVKSGMFLEQKNAQGFTPLQYACLLNETDLVLLLAESGANVEPENERGANMLHYAFDKDYATIAEILLKFGANPMQKDRLENIPLDYLKQNIEAKDDEGCTKLHRAFANKHFKVAELLLIVGADQTGEDIVGNTPIDYLKQNMEVKDAQWRTKLHHAFANNSFKVAELLLIAGADQTQQDIFGKTPIDYLKQNMEVKDIDGLTKLDYALKNNCSKVADILRKLAHKDSSEITLLQN